jgi:hypothetical protein
MVTFNNSSAITVTVNGSTGLTAGQSIDILQLGTGQITVTSSGGMTLNATPGLKFRARYSSATLFCISHHNYVLIGDLSS